MSFEIKFPEPKPKVIFETPFMIEVMDGVMNNQLMGNMGCWYGNAGIGKTTLAELLEEKINEAFTKTRQTQTLFARSITKLVKIRREVTNRNKGLELCLSLWAALYPMATIGVV
jgi:hypothetical protein